MVNNRTQIVQAEEKPLFKVKRFLRPYFYCHTQTYSVTFNVYEI